MIWIKQSTAVTIKFGPFVDDADGKTAETALSIAQADIRLSKNGGDVAQTNNSAGATHDELGYYDVPLNSTDTNTLGALRLAVHKSGALPVWQDFMVVPANIWDSFFGSDYLQVDATQILGTAVSTPATAGVLDVNVKNWKGSTAPDNTGDAYARLGAPAGASVSADVAAVKTVADAVKTQTDKLNFTGTDVKATLDSETVTLASGTHTGAVIPTVTSVTNDVGITQTGADKAWSTSVRALTDKAGFALSTAGIQAVWDALTSALTTAGSIGKRLADYIDAAVSSRSTYAGGAVASVTAAVTVGTNNDKSGYSLATAPPTAAQIRSEMDSNSTKLANLDATVSSRSTLTAQGVWEYATRTLSGFGTLVSDIWSAATRTLSAFGFNVTASSVTDKTGYSLTSAYDAAKTAAQAGEAMTLTAAYDAAKSAASQTSVNTVDTVVDAIKAQTDHLPASPASVGDIPTAASIRQEMDANSTRLANLDASVSSRATASDIPTANISAIKAKTDNLPASPAAVGSQMDLVSAPNATAVAAIQSGLATAANLATVDGIADAIKAKTDNLPAAPAATGDIPTAIQNADALLKRDMSAVTGEAARSPLNALRAIRNKTSMAGGMLTVTKEDDATAAWTAAITTDATAEPIIGVDPS